ncbi:MAG: hypothetical protein OXI96_01495 [Acidimicrobiaceae bacterium]|nr:hypothetical protein [Acidimicrobiaceae bacterium]
MPMNMLGTIITSMNTMMIIMGMGTIMMFMAMTTMNMLGTIITSMIIIMATVTITMATDMDITTTT